MRMKSILKKIVILAVSLLSIRYSLFADIVIDDVHLDNQELRTLYVGALTVTPSAGMPRIAFELSISGLAWSPDGRYIASTRRTDFFAPKHRHLLVQDSKSLHIISEVEVFSDDDAWFLALSWSPTSTAGASYLASAYVSSTVSTDIYVYKFNGTSLQLLPLSSVSIPGAFGLGTDIQWSPNGQYLAASSTNYFNIYNFNGSQLFLVQSINDLSTSNIGGTAWSPDCKYVGYIDANAQAQIYKFDGNSLTLFITTPFIEVPSIPLSYLYFHPIRKVFAMTRYRNDGFLEALFYSYTDDGIPTLLQTLAIGTENPSDRGTALAWSPDGAYFATGANNIYFYSFDGTTATNIPAATIASWNSDVGSPMVWSPDGRFIAIGQATVSSVPPVINGISESSLQIFNTGLNPTPSLAEAIVKAPVTLTNIVTSTFDSQFWAINNGSLIVSSTESVITRMRGAWVPASSQGSLINSDFTYLLNNSFDGNFYALDRTGKVHQSVSVVVGPQVRINWQVLPFTSGESPVLVSLFQGLTTFLGLSVDDIIYKYRPASGWLNVGNSPL